MMNFKWWTSKLERVLKCRSAAADTKCFSPTRGRQASISEEERWAKCWVKKTQHHPSAGPWSLSWKRYLGSSKISTSFTVSLFTDQPVIVDFCEFFLILFRQKVSKRPWPGLFFKSYLVNRKNIFSFRFDFWRTLKSKNGRISETSSELAHFLNDFLALQKPKIPKAIPNTQKMYPPND